MTLPKRAAGSVRMDRPVRADVDRYATDHGISYNAAMNILVRAGLAAEGYGPNPVRTVRTSRTVRKVSGE